MKAFFNVLTTVFVCLGASIGAGFVSGSELVAFFGVDNFFGVVLLSCVLTAICFCLVFSVAKNQEFAFVKRNLFGQSKVFNGASVVCNFLFFVSMIAGLDAVWDTLDVLKGLPVLSLLSVILISFLARFGIKGLEKLNLYLMPLVIVIVLLCAFTADKGVKATGENGGVINAVLYCFLNTFVSMPVLFATAKGKSKNTLLVSSLIVALVILVLSVVILTVVKNNANSQFFAMPFCLATTSSPFNKCLSVALIIGAFTSGASAYHPVYQAVKGRYGWLGVVVIGVVAFTLSRLGLTAIVKYVYPLIAGFGGLYLVKMAVYKFGIKDKLKAHNNSTIQKGKLFYVKKEK